MSKEIEEINLIADLIEDFHDRQDEIGQKSSTIDDSKISNEVEAEKINADVSDNLHIIDVLLLANELVESCTDSLDFCDKLALLSKYCQRPEVPFYLIHNKLLHKILNINPTCVEEKNTSMTAILQMFTKYFFDDAFELMSCDTQHFINFVNRIQYSNKNSLCGLFTLIHEKIIPHIKRHPQSNWILHLKQFVNLERYLIMLFAVVTENRPGYGSLIHISIKMLHIMSETHVSFGTNLLAYLFNSNQLIKTLLIFCLRVVKTERDFFKLDVKINVSGVILYWLLIMINLIKYKDDAFQEFNNKYNIFMNVILYKILKPYEESDISSLIVNIKREEIIIIRACMNLFFFHYNAFCPRFYRLLMNIAFRIKTGLDSRKEVTPQEDLYKLVSDFKLCWLWMIEKCDEIILFNIIHICEPEVKQYITDLVTSDGLSNTEKKLQNSLILKTFNLTD